MTLTKVCDVSTEPASITDAFTELLVQLVKLIRQETYHNEAHCLRKTSSKTHGRPTHHILNAMEIIKNKERYRTI